MKKASFLILVMFLLSCDDAVQYDKEVRLYFNFKNYGVLPAYTSTPIILPEANFLRNFNKKNYPNLKSITFRAFLDCADTDIIVAELYNVTDEVLIEKSLVSTSSPDTWVDSENILNTLPNKEIDLGISIHSENETGQCQIFGAELILKRN